MKALKKGEWTKIIKLLVCHTKSEKTMIPFQGCAQRKIKSSDPVKSRLPSIWLLWKRKKKLSFPNYTRTKTMALLGHNPSVGIMDPFRFFFFNFWHGPIRENPSTPQERAPLKLVTLPGLEVIWLKWLQIELHKVLKIYRRLYGGGRGASLYPPIVQTSVKFQTWRF